MKKRKEIIIQFIIENLSELIKLSKDNLDSTFNLIGEESVVDSRDFLELMLSLELFTKEKFQIYFDWPAMMSLQTKNHPAKTILSLAAYIDNQK